MNVLSLKLNYPSIDKGCLLDSNDLYVIYHFLSIMILSKEKWVNYAFKNFINFNVTDKNQERKPVEKFHLLKQSIRKDQIMIFSCPHCVRTLRIHLL